MFIFQGVFSAALSSLSTGLNSMSAVVLEDFFKPFTNGVISEAKTSLIMRGTVLILGVLAVVLVYVVQHMGSVLQLSMSVPTACFGPLLGLYIIGFCLPWIGRKAALYATMLACFSMMLLVFKAQAEIALGNIQFDTKPLVTDGCTYNFTHTETSSEMPPLGDEDHEKHIYEISYLYYTPVGSSIVIIASIILSFIFGFQDPKEVDPRLLAPFMRKYISGKSCEQSNYVDAQGKNVIVHKFNSKEDEK